MTSKSSTETAPDLDVPVIVALADITDLLPSRAPQTVYRWRLPRNGKEPALPPPLAICARTPIYRLDTVLELAEAKGIPVDQKVLRRIRKEQGRAK